MVKASRDNMTVNDTSSSIQTIDHSLAKGAVNNLHEWMRLIGIVSLHFRYTNPSTATHVIFTFAVRSEGGADCQRLQEQNGGSPNLGGGGRSYSQGKPPSLPVPITKTEDAWPNNMSVTL